MKSQKRRDASAGKAAREPRRRWYQDACGTALALELVGERWALLIIRELMFGPRRFGDIRGALPGLSANILTQRLEGLEKSGILVRRSLPPPASMSVYALTSWGLEAEAMLQVMGRWAVRSPDHDLDLGLSAASLMMSLRTMHDPALAADLDIGLGFRMGEDSFVARYDRHGIEIRRGPIACVDVAFIGAPAAIAGAIYGGALLTLEAEGALAIEGDRALALTLAGRFPLPAKWTAADAD